MKEDGWRLTAWYGGRPSTCSVRSYRSSGLVLGVSEATAGKGMQSLLLSSETQYRSQVQANPQSPSIRIQRSSRFLKEGIKMSGDDWGALGVFLALLLPLLLVAALGYYCLRAIVYVVRAIRDAIVNSPEWEAFMVDLNAAIARQKMTKVEAQAAKAIEGASQQAVQRFEKAVSEAERVQINGIRRG